MEKMRKELEKRVVKRSLTKNNNDKKKNDYLYAY